MKAAADGEAQTCRKYDLTPSRPSSFAHITPKLTTFTCGHVIPPSNVATAYLASGPSGRKLDFRHASRSSNEMIDELGRTLLNLCNIVPSGFVVFLPSYNYESVIFQRWRSTGMLSQIHAKKPIHREPKSSRDLDAALSRYSSEASSLKTGAILFSVMGGKMSEGINFANEMARAVLVVGLPYPDITDPVLVEKMQSLDREYQRTGLGITGQSYYQNLCMRTVNQSVGRAIRHASDYAAIILADFRYTSDARIWKGLPVWMRSETPPDQTSSTFGKVVSNVRSFFMER
jgi:chromosome transmission fidelity protein 1